jgi:hypothetical protein
MVIEIGQQRLQVRDAWMNIAVDPTGTAHIAWPNF